MPKDVYCFRKRSEAGIEGGGRGDIGRRRQG